LEASIAERAGIVSADIITLRVNGEVHQLSVEPQWTLQYVLADKLGLTGTKEFCAEGACGACSVILEGRPVLSCMMLAIECGGATIETIEGIARANHPLIDAYVKHSCMQCGFCTPGFVVTAKALLDRNPDPTLDEIKEAMVGNLCRCGTYPAHIKAILEAAAILRGVVEADGGVTMTASVPINAAIGARAAGMASGGVGPAAPVGATEGGGSRE
jgi:aerobic-type carbon monoxide dehydrogenase small subunit (CoxS/CutS family)